MIEERKKFIKDNWRDILYDFVVPFRGAIRLAQDDKLKGSLVSGAFELVLLFTAATAFNEGHFISGAIIYLCSNYNTNAISGVFVENGGKNIKGLG